MKKTFKMTKTVNLYLNNYDSFFNNYLVELEEDLKFNIPYLQEELVSFKLANKILNFISDLEKKVSKNKMSDYLLTDFRNGLTIDFDFAKNLNIFESISSSLFIQKNDNEMFYEFITHSQFFRFVLVGKNWESTDVLELFFKAEEDGNTYFSIDNYKD
jgi:hypothetical protein